MDVTAKSFWRINWYGIIVGSFLSLLCLIFSTSTQALTLPLPNNGDTVVGQTQVILAEPGDDLHQIARRYNIGYDELRQANPQLTKAALSPWTKVIIPSQFVLPNVPHQGIVINLAEKRLYYFPAGQNKVITFPIAVGKSGWSTPLADTQITQKTKDPIWTVPASILAESARKGIYLPKYVPPGPKNPLGQYALRLAIPGVLLHGTLYPNTIGTSSSHGCMRLYPEDIQHLYNEVPVATPVKIINQPYKIGQLNNQLYVEISSKAVEQPIVENIQKQIPAYMQGNTLQLNHALQNRSGMPTAVASILE